MRKLIVTLLLFIIQVNILSPAALAKSKFSDLDVKQYAWAMDSVNFMIDKGIVNGYEDGTFKPDQSVTKAELGVMIHRLLADVRSEEKMEFLDLPKNHWGYKEVIDVYSDRFVWVSRFDQKRTGFVLNPDAPVTRWEVLLIINSLLGKRPNLSDKEILSTIALIKDIKIKRVISIDEYRKWDKSYDLFTPVIAISTYNDGKEALNFDVELVKAEALYKMHINGIITADNNGYFRPNDAATRAEVMTILHRVYNAYNQDETVASPPAPEPIPGGTIITGDINGTTGLGGDLKYDEIEFTVTTPKNAKFMSIEIESTEKIDVYVTYEDGRTAFIRQEELFKVKVPVEGTKYVQVKTQVREPNLNKQNVSYKAMVYVSFQK
jgi:hypothetical protein